MKKIFMTAAAAATMTAALSMAAFAGQWTGSAEAGWKYLNDNGTYATGWNWITSEVTGSNACYYFDADGNLAVNTTIDGYQVNEDGAWVNKGIVVTSDKIEAAADYTSDLSLIQGTWKYTKIMVDGQEHALDSYTNETRMIVNGSDCSLTTSKQSAVVTLSNITDYAKNYYSESSADVSSVTAFYTDGSGEFRLLNNGTMTLSNPKTGYVYTIERAE